MPPVCGYGSAFEFYNCSGFPTPVKADWPHNQSQVIARDQIKSSSLLSNRHQTYQMNTQCTESSRLPPISTGLQAHCALSRLLSCNGYLLRQPALPHRPSAHDLLWPGLGLDHPIDNTLLSIDSLVNCKGMQTASTLKCFVEVVFPQQQLRSHLL